MSTGKRAAARPKARFRPALLGLACASLVCLAAWGYLVYLAIDHGAAARGGESGAWGLFALTGVGAVACLFLGLMLLAKISRALGITHGPRR